MTQFVSTLSAIFWGVLVLSILVTAHEAGHYFAARFCKARVTEFFIGMPSRHKWSRRSKKHGTEFGVTPVLLGGYTKICGMSPLSQANYAQALALVQAHGSISVEQAADELGCSVEDAYATFETLVDWASIEPHYELEDGQKPDTRVMPTSYKTTLRDASFHTKFDDSFDETTQLMPAGSVQPLQQSAEAFLAQEQKNIYIGKKFWARFLMIFAGPVASFITGLLFMVLSLSVMGKDVPTNVPTVGSVVEDSLAQQVGLQAGDTLVSIGEQKIDTFTDFVLVIKDKLDKHESFELTYKRDGASQLVQVVPDQNTKVFGVRATVEHKHFSIPEAIGVTWNFSVQIAQFAVKLIIHEELPADWPDEVSQGQLPGGQFGFRRALFLLVCAFTHRRFPPAAQRPYRSGSPLRFHKGIW